MKQQSMCVIQNLPKPSTVDEDEDWVKKSKHPEGGQWSLYPIIIIPPNPFHTVAAAYIPSEHTIQSCFTEPPTQRRGRHLILHGLEGDRWFSILPAPQEATDSISEL